MASPGFFEFEVDFIPGEIQQIIFKFISTEIRYSPIKNSLKLDHI